MISGSSGRSRRTSKRSVAVLPIRKRFDLTVESGVGKAWPIRVAFFPTQSDSAQPEYERSLHLLDNGIAESMQIDYGDFTVNAVLDKIEALPKSGC